jgi:hypothetical protein
MIEELNDSEKNYLGHLFREHDEAREKKLHEELSILSKYKGDLARKYEQCGAYQNTLVGCMKDIINKQDELFHVMRDLIKVITGKYPESTGRLEGIEL